MKDSIVKAIKVPLTGETPESSYLVHATSEFAIGGEKEKKEEKEEEKKRREER
jgi:hypothetical protein